ncbi:13329_t:CDS:2, partial [Entrophospora sp. SA101]
FCGDFVAELKPVVMLPLENIFIPTFEEITASLQAIDNLLETVQQQATELENNKQLLFAYQAQTQGLHTKLTRKKPRRLSLDSGEVSYVEGIMSPRRGSSRSDHDHPFSPFLSPHSPYSNGSVSPSSSILELDNISNLVEERENELTESAAEVISTLQTSESNLRQQVGSLAHELSQKEDYIKHLVEKKEEQEKIILELEQVKSEKTTLQAKLTKLEENNKKLEEELAETNNDFLLITEKNNELNRQLLATYQKQTELEQKLEHEINERERLEDSKEQFYSSLLAKYQEICQAKESSEREKEELANLIRQQENDYEQERIQREKVFQKQLDNLRTFQINSSLRTEVTKLRGQRHHHSFSIGSVPSSRANSPYDIEIKDEEIIFSTKPKSRPVSYDLSAELKKQGYQEQSGKFGIITKPEENVFETSLVNPKRKSTSSLLNQSLQLPPANQESNNSFDALFANIDDLVKIENDVACQQLQEEKKALEAQTQKLNEEFELGQIKYELQESKARQSRIDKELVNAYNQIDELEEKLREQEADLVNQNEISQDELAKVRNERDSQRLTFTNLADKVEHLEEDSEEKKQQLDKLKQLNQQQDLKIKELEKQQKEAIVDLDGLEQKEREFSALIEQAEQILKIRK